VNIAEGQASRTSGPSTRLLRAHLGWILLVTAAVIAGAAVLSCRQTPMYRSATEVLVEPWTFADTATTKPPNMGTEKEIASSGKVLALALRDLGLPQRDPFRGLSVTVPVDTYVLRIAYSHPNPAEAQRRAQGIAQAYVSFRAKANVTAQSGGKQSGGKSPGKAENIPKAGARAQVITPASLPVSPVSPNHVVNIGVALIIGLVLGVGTAVVRDLANDRLRGAPDVEVHSGAPVLALVPAVRRSRRDGSRGLVAVDHPDSLAAEAFRDLRTRLLQVAPPGAKTLLVTSSAGEQQKTTVAANVAAALALSGRRVVLVCADFRQAWLPALFGVDNSVGLTSVVRGVAGISQALQNTQVPGLRLVAAGPPVRDPGAIAQAPGFRRTLDDLQEQAEFVIVDAPPVLAGPETSALAALTEMILLVVDARSATRTQVRAGVRQLGNEGLIGVVLANAGRSIRLRKASRTIVPIGQETADTPLPELVGRA
jgi:succinoglycan biosynthesis transport protein ExoP